MTGRELTPLVQAAGARLIDSPVLGTIPSARDGKLFAMLGGRPEDIEHARPVLEKLTRKIVHMGPSGAGYSMKLAVNLGLAAFIQATAESLALGTREGLGLQQMLDVLAEAPTANGWFAAKKKLLMGEPDDITLDLKTLRKDMLSAVATGALSGTGMPLSAGVLTALSAAVAQGWAMHRLWGVLPHQLSADESPTRRGLRYAVAVFYVFELLLAAIGLWYLGKRLLVTPAIWGVLLLLAFTAVHTVYWTDLRMRAQRNGVVTPDESEAGPFAHPGTQRREHSRRKPTAAFRSSHADWTIEVTVRCAGINLQQAPDDWNVRLAGH
jgi:hypothetical protein